MRIIENIRSQLHRYWRPILIIAQVFYATGTLLVPFLVPMCSEPQKQAQVPIIEKQLKILEVGYASPLKNLKTWQDGGKVRFSIGDKEFANISTFTAIVQNSGKVAILPGDIHEPLSLRSSPPWEIIAVESLAVPKSYVGLKWQKDNPNKFTAAPSLLNAEDSCLVTAYITNPSKDYDADPSAANPPVLTWDIRVAGLKSINFHDKDLPGNSKITELASQLVKELALPYVLLSGKRLIATWVLAIINLVILIHLMILRGYAKLKPWTATILFVLAGALSAGSAECITTYFFGDPIWNIGQYLSELSQSPNAAWIYHVLNVPPILLYVGVLLYLLMTPSAQKRRKSAEKILPANAL